jgi:ankyrin repeat protein
LAEITGRGSSRSHLRIRLLGAFIHGQRAWEAMASHAPATTKAEWLRVQQEIRHRQIVAVNQTLTATPSLYFGTRRCTYSDVISVVTTVRPLPRFIHDATLSPVSKSTKKVAWDLKPSSSDRDAEPPPLTLTGSSSHYVDAPLEGDRERDTRSLARMAFALAQERTAFLAVLHERRKKRFHIEQAAALVVQRVYRGYLLRRRFMSIEEKLRVRKRIRISLVKVTKGTAIVTGEKDRRARLLTRQHEAAHRIQLAFRHWRGRFLLRRERTLQIQELRHKRATLIQRVWRKAIAQAVVRKLRDRLQEQQRHHLAVLLTRVYRGYRARQHVRRIRLRQQRLASQRIHDAVRCFHARKTLGLQRQRCHHERTNTAARTIQKRVRGVQARAFVLFLRHQEDRAIRVACALTIQRVIRGFRGRQRMRFLRLFHCHALAWQCGLHTTRIVRGFLGRRRAKYERLDQETDLLVQVAKGNTSSVIDLLDGFGVVDQPVELTTAQFTTKNHALHVACRHGHMQMLTLLLPKFLADAPQLIYAQNAKRETPLELAICHGHEKLASFLLTKTADLFREATSLHVRTVAHGNRARSLLLEAARFGLSTIVLKLVALFPGIFSGKERDAWSQRTVLHEVLLLPRDHYEDTKTSSLHNEIICVALDSLLAKLPLDINAQDLVGFTPLHVAAMLGNARAVQSLLDSGADVTLKDKEDRTAWRLALLHGHEACFLAIRRKWLSNVAIGTNGLSPPPPVQTEKEVASETDLARALTQAATRGRNGMSSVGGRRRVALNLQPHLADDLLHAARHREMNRVQFFLEECHANANACDPNGDGDSLLMVVLHDKNVPLLRYLLQTFGDELDLTYVNRQGRSVMDAALQSPLLLKILIHEGHASPCLPLDTSKQHRTASHEAVRRGYDLRSWLRGYKFMASSLVPLVDDAGRTPLHEAAAFGNVAAGTLLLNAGLRADVMDLDQRTPLHDACRSGTLVLVKKMVQKYPEALWMRDAAGQLPLEAVANPELLHLLVDGTRPGITMTQPNEGEAAGQ